MNKTAWKPAEELRYLLEDTKRVSIFSCGVCANLSGTGGARGSKYLAKVLERWGKKVDCAECVVACCSVEIMRQALRRKSSVIRLSDALVIISCAAGVKSAFLCKPGIPIIPAVDSVGSVPVSHADDPIAFSRCTNCGSCVIALTGGICPLSECPTRMKYKPCARYGEAGKRCVMDASRNCIWTEIEHRGDLEALEALRRLHEKRDDLERMVFPARRHSPKPLRRISGFVVAHSGWFGRLVPFVD